MNNSTWLPSIHIYFLIKWSLGLIAFHLYDKKPKITDRKKNVVWLTVSVVSVLTSSSVISATDNRTRHGGEYMVKQFLTL